METRQRIGWNLRRLRADKGLSQENLAVDANVDRTTISGIEQGSYNASIDLLDRLIQALGADIAELFVIPMASANRPKPLRAGRKQGANRN